MLTDGKYEPIEDGPPPLLATLLNVAAPAIALVIPPVASSVAIAGALANIFDQRRLHERISTLADAIAGQVPPDQLQLGPLTDKLSSASAQEAVSVAVAQTLFCVRAERIRRFGAVVGSQLAVSSPNWDEAVEFIHSLESLSDDDISAMTFLWDVQHQKKTWSGDNSRGEWWQQMSTNPNDYTGTWTDVLERVENAGIGDDDWYSRLARLSGFGLSVVVASNSAHQTDSQQCFRLTGRGVRLLQMLGIAKR